MTSLVRPVAANAAADPGPCGALWHKAGVLLLAAVVVAACGVDNKGVAPVPGEDGSVGVPPDDDGGGAAPPPASALDSAAPDAPGTIGMAAGDATPAPGGDGAAPDAAADLTCVDRCVDGSTLRSCATGMMACALGCSEMGGAHCLLIQPAGGGVAPGDLVGAAAAPVVIASSTVVHGDTGEIEGVRPAGPATINGIGFHLAGGIGVFTTAGLTIAPGATVAVVGPNPVAFAASGEISLGGVIDARGSCVGTVAGPGGGEGGALQAGGKGPGGGGPGAGRHDSSSGGAGAGHGAPGGQGGASIGQVTVTGGVPYPMTRLTGGSGGGGGGGPSGGVGGGGGGAIQLVAAGMVAISGGINAGGCGGKRSPDDGGGGGGSGGAILIEAPAVVLAGGAILAVNGGGGAASDSGGQDGHSGQLSDARSAGGTSGDPSGAAGGPGGAGTRTEGGAGGSGLNAGGGGGGTGRIVLNSLAATATVAVGVMLSPPLGDPTGATVQGRIELR